MNWLAIVWRKARPQQWHVRIHLFVSTCHIDHDHDGGLRVMCIAYC